MSVLSLRRALQALMQCWWQRLMCRKRRGLRSTRNFIITQASLSAWAGWPQWRRKPHPGDVKKFTNSGESASVTFLHRFLFFFFLICPQCYGPWSVTACPCLWESHQVWCWIRVVSPARDPGLGLSVWGFQRIDITKENCRNACPLRRFSPELPN